MMMKQPEFWCGARPCSDCEDTALCVLRDVDQAEINTAAILRKLAKLSGENGRAEKGRTHIPDIAGKTPVSRKGSIPQLNI